MLPPIFNINTQSILKTIKTLKLKIKSDIHWRCNILILSHNKIKEAMHTNPIIQNKLADQFFDVSKTSIKINIAEVFSERKGSYLNEFTLFLAHFNTIPNCLVEINIDCKKANIWFVQNYRSEIKDHYYNKRYFHSRLKAELDDIFYFLYDDLIVDFDTNGSHVSFFHIEKPILACSTNGTFGFAPYTILPLANPKEPFFANAIVMLYINKTITFELNNIIIWY